MLGFRVWGCVNGPEVLLQKQKALSCQIQHCTIRNCEHKLHAICRANCFAWSRSSIMALSIKNINGGLSTKIRSICTTATTFCKKSKQTDEVARFSYTSVPTSLCFEHAKSIFKPRETGGSVTSDLIPVNPTTVCLQFVCWILLSSSKSLQFV